MSKLYFKDLKVVINYIKDNTDILSFILTDINQTDKLAETTSDNTFIFCPLHDETKKPSFCINTKLHIFKCFGCQASGDIIKWTQLYHNLDLIEAIEYISKQSNLDLSSFCRSLTVDEQLLNRYNTIFNRVGEWCHTQLLYNNSLLEWYLTDTGFNRDQLSTYKVGYCPNVDLLVQFLFSSIPNLSRQEISKLELDNTLQFNNALIYPIYNLQGNIARIYTKPLTPSPLATYKYLGTSHNHPLFQKDLVFGLYQLKNSLRQIQHKITLCEGFKAAIAANGVAVMGTSITDDQIKTLHSVHCKQLNVCFDGDQAGYIASIKLIEEIYRFNGINIKIVQLPLDTQPDSIIKNIGKDTLDSLISHAKLPIEYFISNRYDLNQQLSLETKYSLLNDIAPILAKMDTINIDLNSSYLSHILQSDANSIKDYVLNIKIANTNLFNSKAESDILHYILLDPTKWSKLQSLLYTEEHFALSNHRKIFHTIVKSYKEYQTAITAKIIEDKLKLLYITDFALLSECVTTIANTQPEYSFDAAVQIVLDLWRRRNTISQIDDLKTHLYDLSTLPLDAIHKFRKSSVSNLDMRDNQLCDPIRVADKIDQMLVNRQTNGNRILGFDFAPSGLSTLNFLLSGIQLGHYYVIAANQGVGKSALALNIVNPIAIDQKIPTLWIAQEMPEEDNVLRLYSMRTGINNNRMQAGNFKTQDEYLLYCKARDEYASSNLYFRRPVSGTIDEVFAIIEEYKFKYGIQVVVWDYIQLVQPTYDQRSMSREQVLSHASTVLQQQVAGTLGLATIAVAQLNRDAYKKGELRDSEKIGGSYKITQDASDVIIPAEKTPQQIEDGGKEHGNRFLLLDKRRGGVSDFCLHADFDQHTTISLKWRECMTIDELSGFSNVINN
jgi:DNA primase catalytic core